MEEKIIYKIPAIYRDDFRIRAFSFGSGEKSACIVGSMRGNENQQLFACSMLVKELKRLEREGRIQKGKEVLVVPCLNPYSINIKKRFWPIDNTDINRMFPGYEKGETTQRIAAGVFEQIKGYSYGIQFASFYRPGTFLSQVRIMKTGFENVELAKQFSLPYVVLHTPRPFDTTTLNYNWQIWETEAFSIYTTNTSRINKESAKEAVTAILMFLSKQGIIRYEEGKEQVPTVVESAKMASVRTTKAGFFESAVGVGEKVKKGQVVACVIDPYVGEEKEVLYSPIEGTVAFLHEEAMTYSNAAVLKIIP